LLDPPALPPPPHLARLGFEQEGGPAHEPHLPARPQAQHPPAGATSQKVRQAGLVWLLNKPGIKIKLL
jgi:hypothetical protein